MLGIEGCTETYALGQLSAVVCGSFLLGCLYLEASYAYRRVQACRRKSTQGVPIPQSLKFLHTQFGALFVTLILADCLQAVAFAMGFMWVQQSGAPTSTFTGQRYCKAQGALIAAGNVSSCFSSLAIALHTCHLVILARKPKWWLVWTTIALVWFATMILTIAGPLFVHHKPGKPFYGFVGICQ
jgi:hypothetical protein